jgi:hypothetical protein
MSKRALLIKGAYRRQQGYRMGSTPRISQESWSIARGSRRLLHFENRFHNCCRHLCVFCVA